MLLGVLLHRAWYGSVERLTYPSMVPVCVIGDALLNMRLGTFKL